jgi:hypothetical protein
MRDLSNGMNASTDEERRRQQRARSDAFRDRRRHGRMLVSVEVSPSQLAALERLALLDARRARQGLGGWGRVSLPRCGTNMRGDNQDGLGVNLDG